MSNENSQESAFPLVYDGNSAAPFCHNGLTKREYFAAMAMQGMCQNLSVEDLSHPEHVSFNVAAWSVRFADELLKQLES